MTQDIQGGVLHGLMSFGPDCWYAYGARLLPEMFDGEKRDIFSAIAKLNRDGKASDFVMVSAELGDDTEAAALARQIGIQTFMSKASMKAYIEHLRQAWRVSKARDIGALLAENGDTDSAKTELMALDAGRITDTVSGKDANVQLIDDLTRRVDSTGGLSTGLADLDNLLCGLEGGDLCVIAARPSMGKTALMLNIALNAGVPCGIFSLEMSTPQLMTRLVAAQGVDYGRLRRPVLLDDADWAQVTKATVRIADSGLWINDTGGLPIGALESEAYRMVRALGVGLLCVDYLQLVTHKAESRLEVVSEVSRRLKALAKNLRVPVIALSQMNRAVEGRGTPTPRLSDLRETGQIEQDADQIIFIHRPEVLAKADRPGEADFIVAKNRGGEVNTVSVAWQGRYQRFQNLSKEVTWGNAA